MYFNRIVWAGHLGDDARSFKPTSEGGRFMLTFSVAQTKHFRRSDGSFQDQTTWVDCKGWYSADRHAALLPKLVQGAHVYIEGELEIEKKVVGGVERSFTQIVVKEIQFFPKLMRAAESAPKETPAPPRAQDESPDAFNPAKFAS